MSEKTVVVPNIGDFEDIEIIEIPVSVGDKVAVEDPLVVLESDKASMEVPSDTAGEIKELLVKVGDKISEGSKIAIVVAADDSGDSDEKAADSDAKEEKSEDSSSKSDDKAGEAPKEETGPTSSDKKSEDAPKSNDVAEVERQGQSPAPVDHDSMPPINQSEFIKAHASPSVRAYARELGADISKITGTGRKERITKDDVTSFVKSAMQASQAGTQAADSKQQSAPQGGMGIPPIPAVDFSKFGEVREEKLSRIQKISGPHLHRSWLNVPLVTQYDEADVTELENFRRSLKAEAEKKGVRVTSLAFIMKAVAKSLEEFPTFNSSLSQSGDSIIIKEYINIGVAVDTPNGLMVPVFKDVPNKSIYELSEELADTSMRARDGKIRGDDLQGGTFSISSLGGIGGTAFTPLVNAPEVAILGLSRNQVKPVWDGKEFTPRTMLPLSLSYDHRVIDGASGARFTVHLSQLLGDIRRTML